jgi:hypothetical protein
MKKYYSLITFLLLLPQISSAESLSGIKGLLISIKDIIKDLIPITFGLAILAFFYGIAKFIKDASNPELKNKNREIIYWGVIALFVMTSVWGIIGLAQNILGVDKFSTDSGEVSGYRQIGP